MKRTLLLFLALTSFMACTKDNSINGDIPDSDLIDPVKEVLDANAQRERLRDVGEEFIDAVDVKSIQNSIETVMEIGDLNFDKYSEGKAVEAVSNAISSMMTMNGNEYVSVYNLNALKGHYSFIGGVQNVSESDDISINFENKWTAVVTFSSTTTKVLINDYKDSKDYVEIPTQTTIVVSKSNKVIVSASIDLDTNVTDVTVEPDLGKIHAYASATVEFAGYKYSIAKAGYGEKSAICNSYLSKGDQILLSEKLSVNKISFDGTEPTGAGSGQYEMDILGKVQVKAAVSDITALVDYVEKADEYNKNETKFKYYVSEINNLIDNGVYFSSDVKQCYLELYPFQNYKYGYWYMDTVLVLSDGTKYEDITDFFSERYFGSVIDKFENLLDSLEDIF